METQMLPWRGFHHIALVTRDLNATINFYQDVLGMHVTHRVPATERRGAHCFIKPGISEAWGLHFFEDANADFATNPEALQRMFTDPAARFSFFAGALQHIAFVLPDENAALALRERLQTHHVQMTAIGNIGALRNFLFADNNGILLEAAWSKV